MSISNLIESSFAAWSLYTGPSDLKPLTPDSTWILGKWGNFEPNEKLTASSIKQDIDSRIALLVLAFTKYCENTTALNKHFVIPEFFFRCKAGPYPLVEIKEEDELFGQYPLDYIKDRLYGELLEAIKSLSTPNTTYTIVCGSILTSNVEDYESFWQSPAVQRRLTILNSILKPEVSKRKQYPLLKKIFEKTESTYKGDTDKGDTPTQTDLTAQKSEKKEAKHVSWKRHLFSKTNKNESKILGESKKEAAVDYSIDSWMKGFRASPLCTVRNQGIYYYYGSINFDKSEDEKALEVRVYEKKYESNIDLTMGVIDENGNLSHGNMITQWMANYPSYSTVQGDKQSGGAYETNARFDYSENLQQKFDVGVELDIDHQLQRLRRTVGMNVKNGATYNHYPLMKQFIPSAGMQIQAESVSVHGSSVIFNADGYDPIYWDSQPKVCGIEGETPQLRGFASGVYVLAGQSTWEAKDSSDGQVHYSHSQLAFTTPDSIINGYNNELGTKNSMCDTYEDERSNAQITQLTLKDYYFGSFRLTPLIKEMNPTLLKTSSPFFVAGFGELHIYTRKDAGKTKEIKSRA